MSAHVFTYGSLMFPQVWQRVVRGDYRSAPAVLDGHARFALAGETYPGTIVRSGASVAGIVYFDVSDADVAALDAFEGSEYRRDRVRVRLDSGELADAQTYLYLLPQKLSESPWLPEEFQMQRFLGTYCRDRLGE
ncbi:gamma-glutamylcyclotransferase family protein [Noviherbaspirillum aerium]|uniref:gamma-glutamylcyclotransferase family protein n=1 Tax=Noviherbaspirillum aerium TaxID=2588497 RepID=UPI00124EF09C|nr:gamma-glutamylcyclotransferase family protein [Noviherbaspirillum aerium]